MSTPLLVELFTEELPPKALKNLGGAFARVLLAELKHGGLLDANCKVEIFATPRRLAARFSSDGRVVSSGRDNKLQVWNTSGKSLSVLAFSGELPNRVAFTHNGARVVGSDWAGRVLVWDAASGRQVGELESNPLPLSERVVRLGQAVTERRREAEKAAAELVVAEAAAAKMAASVATKYIPPVCRAISARAESCAAAFGSPTGSGFSTNA